MFILCVKNTTNTGHPPCLYLIVHDSASIAFRIGASVVYVGREKKLPENVLCSINACFACYKSLYSGYFVCIMTMMFT